MKYKRPDYQAEADKQPMFDPSTMTQDPDVPEPASPPKPPPKPPKPPEKAKKAGGGMVRSYAKGGLAAGHKSADGCAVRGKTRAMKV